MAGAVVAYHFICLVCEERRTKEVGAANAFVAAKITEICKQGHEMKLDRTEEG